MNCNKSKIVLAIDVDEVLASFMSSLISYHNETYNTKLSADDFFSYEFHKVWGGSREETVLKMEVFFQSRYFLEDLVPIPGAVSAMNFLKGTGLYEFHVVTSRQYIIEQVTRDWISKHFPDIFSAIHFGNHYARSGGVSLSKVELCRQAGAVLLVDDSLLYATQCAAAGLPVVLFGAYAWNRSSSLPKLVSRAVDWDAALALIHTLTSSSPPLSALPRPPSPSPSPPVVPAVSVVVAAVQMCSSADKGHNLARIAALCRAAADRGAGLICLPENCLLTGASGQQSLEQAEYIIPGKESIIPGIESFSPGKEPIIPGKDVPKDSALPTLKRLAVELGVFLSLGGVQELLQGDRVGEREGGGSGRMANAHVVISPCGEVVGHYRKVTD